MIIVSLMRVNGKALISRIARNTAKICNHLDLDQYIGEYTYKVFAEKPSGKKYASRKEIFQDPSLLGVQAS